MKKNALNIMVSFIALCLITGFSAVVLAQSDASDNTDTQQTTTLQRRGEMRGNAKLQHGAKGLGADALSEEQTEKLKAERTAFQTATRDLKMELKSKRLALQSELVKKEPDAKAARALQKEISSLTAELAMKRLEHVLEMKEIAPYSGMGQLENDSERVPAARGRST
jgi:Spy/CpxP family protein refolding chaperone